MLGELERTRELPAAVPVSWRPRQTLALGAAALIALALAAAVGYALGRRSGATGTATAPPSRLAILAPSLGGTGATALHRQLAFTPDGSGIVFVVGRPDGMNALAYQRLDAAAPVPIQGSDRMADPLVSPDGRWLIAYGDTTAAGATPEQGFRLPIGGGSPSALASNVDIRYAGWAADGALWYTPVSDQRLHRLGPDGRVSVRFPDHAGMRLQQVIEGGRAALIVRAPLGTASGPLFVLDLRSGKETPLIDNPVIEARYVTGQLIYVGTDGVLWAVPLDARNARLGGAPVQVATGVSLTGTGQAQLAAAPNGTVAYIPEEPRSLVFADRSGSLRMATTDRRSYHAPKFSPDGRRLSVDFTGGDGRDVWLLSLSQGTLSRATFDHDGHDAVWSPDGRSLTYTSFKSGNFGIYRVRPGTDAPAESLLASPLLGYTGQWLPDGSALVTVGQALRPGSGSDIALVPNGGRGPLKPLIANPLQTQYPAVSPDGRWLAYVSDQSGGQQVFVRPLAGGGEELQVSQQGGNEPVWGPNGRELFYRATNGNRVELAVAELRTAPELAVVSRRTLFSLEEILGTAPHANYDVSPDGKTFAMVKRSPATRIVVLQNLPELVRKLREASAPAQ
jgi:Tol biopolymer transport system component